MDTYRVGTLLELVRSVGLGCHRQGLKIRICVQASMGEGAFTGTPRVLSGVNKLLLMMDWQVMTTIPWRGINVQLSRDILLLASTLVCKNCGWC